MERFALILLSVMVAACNTAPQADSATEPQAPSPAVRSSQTVTPVQPLTRTWVATGITFNGNADPNFDASRRVELKLEPGGAFTMSGSGNSMTGQWKQEGATELQLVDDGTAAPQRFGIEVLDSTRLVLKLLDEMSAEVMLHYRAE